MCGIVLKDLSLEKVGVDSKHQKKHLSLDENQSSKRNKQMSQSIFVEPEVQLGADDLLATKAVEESPVTSSAKLSSSHPRRV
ncbi:hypothetical protein MRB53_018906 [Persea americana]|uniref:Uncharacterized protein n=1 Tax=Persea americana TaxID=3435 RepID=A0ACC2MAN7_PERAE|nr:hypothetical protein MRB53_018906 [Persea americana]